MAMHLRKRRPDAPRHPFWKDERLLGRHIKMSTYVRMLLLALAIFVIVIGYVLFGLINYISHAHQDRLEQQHQTDAKIALLKKQEDAKIAKLERWFVSQEARQGRKVSLPHPSTSPSAVPRSEHSTGHAASGHAAAPAPISTGAHRSPAPKQVTIHQQSAAPHPSPTHAASTSPIIQLPTLGSSCIASVVGICTVR